jgi:RNA polymerase sigma-70 factor (ECF subfamily)
MTHLDLFQRHHPLLFSIAYRLLGSAQEAEDILQEAYLRFEPVKLAEIDNPRAYLSTIVTRLCLNHLASARVRRETYLGPWLPEPVGGDRHPDLAGPEQHALDADSISLAFLVLLENLTPAERAVFILREVFEFSYAEIGEMLEKSEAACRKLFSRARGYIRAHRPRFEVDPEAHHRLLGEFMQAVGQGDLEGLTALLAEDVTFWADGGGVVRGAALRAITGRENVARFMLGVTEKFMPQGAQVDVVVINGQPSILIRHADGRPALVISLAPAAGGIGKIWVIANPEKLGAI